MKGYKAFEKNLTCRDFKYEIGKEYTLEGELEICKNGFHFCRCIADCYKFYERNDDTRICEVEALGTVITDENKIKFCTDKIKIIAEITGEERKANLSVTSTGYCNTGASNTGNLNTGDYNSGNRNTGDLNIGKQNTGDCNIGTSNAGASNTGNRNTGDCNIGTSNAGDYNSGYRNTGDWNIGDRNVGDFNTGNMNIGDYNTGDWNVGNHNTGNWSIGDWNVGNFSFGLFNTERDPKIKIFDKESNWTMIKWINSEAKRILSKIPMTHVRYYWYEDMTEGEKEQHPEAKTCGYYAKLIEVTNEDKQKWWDELPEDDKEEVLSIPNFDPDKFYQCTGIMVWYRRKSDESGKE